ncbi:MAG TPA: dihydrofolate reductase family protein [Bacillota bacterium]|nr:dihydrofolate reductase family protein [Bacillota bacterium]
MRSPKALGREKALPGSRRSPARARSLRPFVLVNMAMTADGKIATANRAAASFGSRRDQAHLLELRATADAVMAGARTVDLNAVTLGPGAARYRRLRRHRGLSEYNLRIVVSRAGTLNPQAELFQHRFSPIVILTTRQAGVERLNALRQVADEVKVCGEKEIHFARALRWLREKWKVQRLLCEGGGELNDALFRAGLVDELHLTVCPRIFGGRQAPTIADGTGAGSLAKAARLQLQSAKRHGEEMFFVYSVASTATEGAAEA